MDGPPSEFSDSIFARRLKQVRTQADVTQQQLADRLAEVGHRIHRSAIAKIEAGDRPVSIGEAVQIAGVLGTTLMDLVTDDMADSRQEREYRQLVEERIRVRSLQHEAHERHKLLEENRVLYENTLERLEAAKGRVQKIELRLKVRDDQAKFGAEWWSPPDPEEERMLLLAEHSETLPPKEDQ